MARPPSSTLEDDSRQLASGARLLTMAAEDGV